MANDFQFITSVLNLCDFLLNYLQELVHYFGVFIIICRYYSYSHHKIYGVKCLATFCQATLQGMIYAASL